jgi:hypothetical protein
MQSIADTLQSLSYGDQTQTFGFDRAEGRPVDLRVFVAAPATARNVHHQAAERPAPLRCIAGALHD